MAEKNNLMLISVIMAAPDYKARLKDAAALLDYGFARCSLYVDEEGVKLPKLPVRKGKKEEVSLSCQGIFRYLDTDGRDFSEVKKEMKIPQKTEAPVQKGAKAGEIIYSAGGKEFGRMEIVYGETVERAGYSDSLGKVINYLWLMQNHRRSEQ